jgi:bacillithiol biosynthesis cysteine-adding enzyme BshC
MGSEDADLAELNHFNVKGKRYEWHTKQTGAVGRMKVDQKLLSLLDELEKQLVTHVHGEEILQLLKQCYSEGNSIMQSTFELVNALFGRFGLVVLIADEAQLKMQATTVFKDDLLQHLPSAIVNQTVHKLEAQYNVQATARDINLFYLDGSVRERIEKGKNGYKVVNTALHFTESEMLDLLAKQPEKLSPNVILRGLYQEIILPNIVFVGGGGEVAYWLELKDLFMHYQVPFPLLVLRNSFLLAGKRTVENIGKTALSYEEIFLPVNEIMFKIVERNSKNEVLLKDGLSKATTVLNEIRQQAGTIDPSLVNHVAAIEKRLIKTLVELEKKMLRAEKRKFSDLQKQVENIKQAIFPGNALQERKENFTGFYAEYGKRFIDDLYEHSLTLEQEFMFLEEAPNQTR